MNRVRLQIPSRPAWRGSAASLALLAALLGSDMASAADRMEPLGLRDVKVGGEIGRRIAVTVDNNLLRLDVDGDFLRSFSEEPRSGKFVGLGMLLDSAVKLAANTGDPGAVAVKRRLVDGIRAARFDAAGRKTANACFVKILHNGRIIHENVEVTGPSRASPFAHEAPIGPLLLQGNHGPVAFRVLRAQALTSADTAAPVHPSTAPLSPPLPPSPGSGAP